MRLMENLGEQLRHLAKAAGHVLPIHFIHARPEDLADEIQRMPADESAAALSKLDPMQAAEVLIEVPTQTARTVMRQMPDEQLAHYLDILPMDDAIELSEELEPERFENLLSLIPEQDTAEIRRLMAYPRGTVGRLMTEHFFEVRPEHTVADMLADLRRAPEDKYETVNDVYVLDERRHLLGVFSLRKALRSQPWVKAKEIMTEDAVVCHATDEDEDAARKMARYGFYALPVIDDRGHMLGVFTGDDAQEILREAETEQVLALGAVSGEAESYTSLSVFQLYKRRVPWLLALFVAETITGAVLRHYGQSSSNIEIPALMLFVPLLIGAGGNAGSQVTTTITRALALGEVRGSDVMRVLGKELLTAVMVGLTLGTLGFARAFLKVPFGWDSGINLSWVVGIALPCIVIWAATVGSILPIVAKKIGLDPAVMSAPFISTFVDATGLIIYFEIARRIL